MPGQPPLHAPGAFAPAPAMGGGKPIGALLGEAFELYRRHIVALLVASAIVLVPLSVVRGVAFAAILAPTVVATAAAQNTIDLSRRATQDWQKEVEQAQGDPKRLQEIQAAHRKQLEDLSRNVVVSEKAAIGGLLASLIGFAAGAVGLTLLFGIAMPVLTGALTILVADLATGGHMGPWQAYGLLKNRLGKLLSAWIPAFFLIMLGFFLLFIPGLVLGFLFTFVAPVVLLENAGGTAALRRSVQLVTTNLPQVAVLCLVFIGLRIVATVAGVFVPHLMFFWNSFVPDIFYLFLIPFPIIATVLLYLDVRRQADGLDAQGVRAGIQNLGS
jgi:uncharacterized membrane protein